MKPSGLVTSGGVRRHTIRRNRKITKAALAGRFLASEPWHSEFYKDCVA